MTRFALVCSVTGLFCLALPAQGDLVSYFDLEEASGIAVKGVGSIGDTNGTVLNPTGTNWVAGAPGGFSPTSGYDFNGGNEFILTDATASELGIDGALPKTVSAWALTRSFNDGGIFDIGQGVSDGRDFSLRTLGGTNQWRAQFTGGSTDFDFIAPGSANRSGDLRPAAEWQMEPH
jgi:hypothetical protein